MPDYPSSDRIDPSPHPPSSSDPTYRFGAFELSTRPLRLLRRDDDGESIEVSIQPQPARALELLAERDGALVTREELRERLWGLDAHLDHEQAINFTIRKVRSALGDSAQRPRYVETLPRQGYRLVVPVERRTEEPSAIESVSSAGAEEPRRSTRHGLRGVAAALFTVAILVGVVWAIDRPPSSSTPAGVDPAQNEALWRARALIDRGDAASLTTARQVLAGLLVEEPDSAAVALTMARWWRVDGGSAGPLGKRFDTYWPEVERWADRARTLDPSLVEAHVLAANARLYLHNDRVETRRILEEEALRRHGDYPAALHLYGLVLAASGEADAAVPVIRRAIALDPENLYLVSDLALTYLLARRYDEAIDQARHNLEVGSAEAWWLLLQAQTLAGQREAADTTAIELTRALYGQEIDGLDALRRLSFDALARQTADGDPRFPAYARWATELGEDEVAIDALVTSCAGAGDWDRPFIGVHPAFDRLREHPRWAELAACLGDQ